MKVLLFIGITFVLFNCTVSLVVIPNEHVHSILIASKFRYKKTWKHHTMKPKIFLDPKAVPASERKRKSRAKQFANMSDEQLKTSLQDLK